MSEVGAEEKRVNKIEAEKKRREEAEVEDSEGKVRKSWKLENSLQPKQRLSMEMSQVEIAGWKRSWNSFYTISQLKNAPLDIVKNVLMGTLEDNLASRVEMEINEQDSIENMLAVIEKEIILRNPKIVSRFMWMQAKQRGDEKYTDFLVREKA